MARDGLDRIAASAEAIAAACSSFVGEVEGLLDALERDIYQNADRSWQLKDRQVQLRGGLLRHKTVVVQEALFQPDVEQRELAGSLQQWRTAVQSTALSAALQVKVEEQQLLLSVARELETADQQVLLSVLGCLLGVHGSVAALRQRPLRPSLTLLSQLAAQVALAWRSAGGSDASSVTAGQPPLPKEVVAVLAAPLSSASEAAAGGLAADNIALPPELSQSLRELRERQAALGDELSGAADMLRFWGRRGEKAVTGSDGGGREGDAPPMLAEAQAALWAACQAYEDEQAASDLRTRQLVCQRYRPCDLAALQAAADQYDDGERLPAQPSLTYESEFVQERGWARARALQLLQDERMALAAEKLHQLQYMVLQAELAPESASAWQQLLVRLAEALLLGGTAPAAVPALASLLLQGLKRQGAEQLAGVSNRDKARLVPIICRGLAAQPGGRVLLRQSDAGGLLHSLLRPELLLTTGQLAEFHGTLQMVVEGCTAASLPSEASAALLCHFDVARFAMLVCERWDSSSSSGSGSRVADLQHSSCSSGGVSERELLSLAHDSLAGAGTHSVGVALLEGLLTLHPTPYTCAALQLALACKQEEGRAGVLGMLCRVPADMLPTPVVADALVQITEAVDSNQLAPPFLPFDLLGRLYHSPSVLRSLQTSVQRGPQAAADEAAAEATALVPGRQLWTARVEGSLHGGDQTDDAMAAVLAEGSGARPAAADEVGSSRPGHGGSRQPGRGSLMLLPLHAPSEPLAVLVQRLVGAVLSSLLRRAGAALDAVSLSEELLQLLEVLLMPAAQAGAWLLDWLWNHLYTEALHPFLADAAAALGDAEGHGPLTSAFLSYWASLPWRQASFHATSPTALTKLRLHLVASADGAAATLLQQLDFIPVLAKAAPPAQPRLSQRVYRLVDDEEEEQGGSDPQGRAAWAAELALLALHACVRLSPQEYPDWLRHLMAAASAAQPATAPAADEGDRGEGSVAGLMRSPLSAALMPLTAAAAPHQPLLPQLLATADWARMSVVVKAEEAAACGSTVPWLLLPLLLAPAGIAADPGSRVVHAATLLSQAAVIAASPQAAECAADLIMPLLLCSVCQGTRHEAGSQWPPPGQPAASAAALATAEPQHAQQERVVIPEGFPLELLADTVEGQQLQLLQQQDQERQQLQQLARLQLNSATEARAEPAASGGGHAPPDQQQQGPQQGQSLPLVEVHASWSLTAGQHDRVVQHALLPLAGTQAHAAARAGLPPRECPPQLAAQEAGGLACWQAPDLPSLLQAAQAAVASAGASAAAHPSGYAGVTALLVPLARPARTILTSDPLPFACADLPLDTRAALYVSVSTPASGGASGGSATQAQPPPRQGLHHTLATLLPGTRRHPQQAELGHSGIDASFLLSQLVTAVQAACKASHGLPLTSCVLRLLYACPALHTCPPAQQLGEGLLRFLAAPEQEGGPLQQGPAAPARAAGRDGYPQPAAVPAIEAPLLGDYSVGSSTAQVVLLEAAASTGDTPPPGGAAAGTATSGSSLHVAVSAAQGLAPDSVLSLSTGAAELQAPLTAALAVERLRQSTTLVSKEDWQGLAAQVLRVAMKADAQPPHPFDMLAPWLAALPWVADSRWRRLPSGPHTAALLDWLESLELRVVVLRLAQPQDFALDGGGSPGGESPPGLLAGAADRFKAMRQRLAGHPNEEGGASVQAAVAATAPGRIGGMGDPQAWQRAGRGLRGLLVRDRKKEEAEEEHGAEGGSGKGWGEKMRQRLGRLGRGGEQEEHLALAGEPVAAAQAPTMAPGLVGTVSARPGLPYSGLGTVAEETGSIAGGDGLRQHSGLLAAAATQHDDGPSLDRPTAQAVKQRISSGLQAVGRTLGKVRTRLGDRPAGAGGADEVSDRDQDVAIRLGLAAFTVSAYIKSVLCPSLTSRLGGDSAGPATPTAARVHHHRQTSSLGSMQRLDAEYMRELDRVLEARSELDSLDVLMACPLLQLHPGRYQGFLGEVPRLLSAATSAESLARSLQHLLFPQDPQLLAWM